MTEDEKKTVEKFEQEAQALRNVNQRRYETGDIVKETEDEKKKEPTTVEQLEQAQAQEMQDLQNVNQQRYENIGDIVKETEGKLAQLNAKDAEALRRSEKYKYISGIGDALAGIANLAGTAAGAQSQQQTYNGNMIAERAEQSRKERKLEMDKISDRLDEMRARAKDMRTAGSLAEAELKAKQAKELTSERIRLDAIAREDAWRQKQQEWKEKEAARAQENLDRSYGEGVRQFNATNTRLTEQGEVKAAKGFEEFNLGNGEFIRVPDSRMGEYNLTELFDMVPAEIKETAGRPKIDSYGEVVGYYPPTQKEMLRAINRAAQTDPAIKDAIRNLGAKVESAQASQPVVGAKTGIDWSARKDSTEQTGTSATPKPASLDPDTLAALRKSEEDILKNNEDSVYIKGNKYAKLQSR